MIILGLDPGTHKTGYGVINFQSGKYSLLDFGVTKTDAKAPLTSRLQKIFGEIREVSSKWKPDIVSIENIFVKKVQPNPNLIRATTLMKLQQYLSEARIVFFDYDQIPDEKMYLNIKRVKMVIKDF